MEPSSWTTTHWFDLLQSLGIVGGLLFTGVSLLIDAKVRRISNLLTITEHHRNIWTHLYQKPELARVLDEHVDLKKQPVTREEELFVTLVILHLSSAQEALRAGMFTEPEGLPRDIRNFFSRPIPKTIWTRIKPLQNRTLIEFIEECQRIQD